MRLGYLGPAGTFSEEAVRAATAGDGDAGELVPFPSIYDTVMAVQDGAIAYHGLVRYDAYNEMSGRQSTSIALLDARGSGVVVSSIHHRDQARFYAKQVVAGQGTLQLSPEEEEAIRVALAGEVPDRAEQRR